MEWVVSPAAKPASLQPLISVSKIFKDDLGRNKKPGRFLKASVDTRITKVLTSSLAGRVSMAWNEILGTTGCLLLRCSNHGVFEGTEGKT